jgi:class 3 adenylate cyclase
VGYERLRTFVTLIRGVVASARREPLLILLDDMHWADASSLELLGQLVFMVTDAAEHERLPLMVVAGHRPVAADHKLAKLVKRCKLEPVVSTLELDGFGPSETAEFLQRLGIARVANPLIDTVQRVTHGYPLFVQEMLHQLELRGCLEQVGGYTTLRQTQDEIALPSDVTSAFRQRLEALSEADADVLSEIALAAADSFMLARMQRIVQLPSAELQATIERALQADLFTVDPIDQKTYRFRHILIRQVLVDRLSVEVRRALHVKIARALVDETASGSLSLEIAGHLLDDPSAEPELLLLHARRGADYAYSLYAYAQAARMYAAAADCAASLRDTSLETLAQLHFLTGVAYQHDSDFSHCTLHYGKALTAFTQAGNLVGQAETLRSKTRVAYLTAATTYGVRSDLSQQERILTQLGAAEPRIRGELLEAMSQVHWTARDTARAIDSAERALSLAEETDDERLRHHAHFSLGLALFQSGDLQASLHSYTQSLASAVRTGDPRLRVPPLQRLALSHVAHGDLTLAEQLSTEARTLATRIDYGAEISFAVANLASLALARGDFAAVEELAHEALKSSQRARYPWSALIGLFTLAWSRALEGRYADARYAIDLLGKPGDVFDEPGPAIQFSVVVWRDFLRGDEDLDAPLEAERERLSGLMQILALSPFDASAAGALCVGALSAVRLHLPEAARITHERLERLAQRGMRLTSGGVFLIQRVLGLTSALLGQSERAEAYFLEAIAIAERIGAKPELACSLLAYGTWLASSEHARKPEAGALALRACEVFTQLGLTVRAARAARLQALCGLGPKALIPQLSGVDLDARERLLLRRVAQGRRYPDIAAELLIEADRAAEFADQVFAKIGVTGTSLATAYAFAHGLLGPESLAPPGPTTLVVTDMVDFTGLVQRAGDLHARTVMHVHNRTIRQHVTQHHGREVTHTGDGLMLAFTSGMNAAHCAIAIQRSFAVYNQAHTETPIRVRVGINSGHVLPEEDRLFGVALIAAVRVCSCAKAGQILATASALAMTDGTFRARANSVGRVELKGFSEPAELYELPWR